MKRSFIPFVLLVGLACVPRQAGQGVRSPGFDPAGVRFEDVLMQNPDSVPSEAIKAYNEKDYARSASAYLA